MKSNSQLSDVLHVLLHLAQADAPMTSEALASAMGTRPVVLRRLMGGLREAGFVSSEKGHGGGWVMPAALERVTLAELSRGYNRRLKARQKAGASPTHRLEDHQGQS